MLREGRDVRPELLKFGVAVALSLGGILYAFLRTKKSKPSRSPSPQPYSGDQTDVNGERNEHRIDNQDLQRTADFCNSTSVGPEKYDSSLPKSSADSFISKFSPSDRLNGDNDSYLLPEFDELVKDISFAAAKAGFSPRKDIDTLSSDGDMPREYKCVQSGCNEQEIRSLRNMLKILKERERNLEIQLLEYYGFKEQETSALELQNRLRVNNMEAKLFSLKIESLQAENRRLEEQIAEHAKVAAELEAAKTKIKVLKKKLSSESEHNKEQILALQERVMKLHEQEKKAVVADPDVQVKLQKLNDLEEQADELRKSNSRLRRENSELAQKLEYLQLLATSVLEDQETTALKEESHRLKEEKEELMKDIERLQADHCTDVEELVYLRWLNACLRYELRNYQPGPGKTIARDLSKTLSFRSEDKAKQLIVEYATKEGESENVLNPTGFDSGRWSSSQASYLTDSGELEDSPVDISSAHKTHTSSKRKLFGKLMRLLRGKDSHHHHYRRSLSSETTTGVEDMVGRYSSDSPGAHSSVSTVIDAGADGINDRSRSSSRGSRYSLDLRGTSDDGSLCILKGIDSIAEDATDSTPLKQLDQDPDNTQKSELIKYAEALKVSRNPSFRRRSVSLNSF